MCCCWIFLDHDPGSTQRRVGVLRILNSAALVCSRFSVDNIHFMRHIEGQLLFHCQSVRRRLAKSWIVRILGQVLTGIRGSEQRISGGGTPNRCPDTDILDFVPPHVHFPFPK
jgi:hypothetical protein